MSALESTGSLADCWGGSDLLWEGLPQHGSLLSDTCALRQGSVNPGGDMGTHTLHGARPLSEDPACVEPSYSPHLTRFSLWQTVEGVRVGT